MLGEVHVALGAREVGLDDLLVHALRTQAALPVDVGLALRRVRVELLGTGMGALEETFLKLYALF